MIESLCSDNNGTYSLSGNNIDVDCYITILKSLASETNSYLVGVNNVNPMTFITLKTLKDDSLLIDRLDESIDSSCVVKSTIATKVKLFLDEFNINYVFSYNHKYGNMDLAQWFVNMSNVFSFRKYLDVLNNFIRCKTKISMYVFMYNLVRSDNSYDKLSYEYDFNPVTKQYSNIRLLLDLNILSIGCDFTTQDNTINTCLIIDYMISKRMFCMVYDILHYNIDRLIYICKYYQFNNDSECVKYLLSYYEKDQNARMIADLLKLKK